VRPLKAPVGEAVLSRIFDVFGNTNIRAERIVIGRKNKDYDPRKITHKGSFHWGWLGGLNRIPSKRKGKLPICVDSEAVQRIGLTPRLVTLRRAYRRALRASDSLSLSNGTLDGWTASAERA
jgi:hypothetical protein